VSRLRRAFAATAVLVAIGGAYALGEYDPPTGKSEHAPRSGWSAVPNLLDRLEQTEQSKERLTQMARALTDLMSPSTVYELLRHERAARSSRQFSDNSLAIERLLALEPADRSGPLLETRPDVWYRPAGPAYLYVGGGEYLAGAWDEAGGFTVTGSRNSAWASSCGRPPRIEDFVLLDVRDIKVLQWDWGTPLNQSERPTSIR